MLKEREQSKLKLSGSPPLPKLKATMKRSPVMWTNFVENGCLLNFCESNPIWNGCCKMLVLMNELTVTSNIGTMSAWLYMTRSEDEWLSAALSNRLPQATWEVSSLPWPWPEPALQCCTQGTAWCVPSVSTAQTALQTKASVWHKAVQYQGWRAPD